MGFFGTKKSQDYDDKEQEEEQEEQQDKVDEEQASNDHSKCFCDSIKGLTEKQLLKLLVMMKYEDKYGSISEDWDEIVKIVREE